MSDPNIPTFFLKGIYFISVLIWFHTLSIAAFILFMKELSVNLAFNSLHFDAIAVIHCFLKKSFHFTYLC